MALPASGSLSIKSAAGADRSISLEVDGNETGNKSLLALQTTAGKSSMTGFYNYSGVGTGCSAAPNAVTDADANVVSNDVTITWTPDTLGEDATQFRIDRTAQSNPGVWVLVGTASAGGGNTITDNDLSSDQYTYRVRAENACGNSSYVQTDSVIVS